MLIWRLCKQKHQNTAFSGEGGLYTSGRWHPQGWRIVYTAESLALATLEVFVHTESDKIPLVAIRARIPNSLAIDEVDIKTLPSNWQEETAYPHLQQIGKKWLEGKQTPILKVPSAIVPVEFNYLLNPLHPDLKFDLEPPTNFKFDKRMWKSLLGY
ncbi:MAG: RES family NAD+ phosphorylase [Cyanobacteriota bacterium ELA615]